MYGQTQASLVDKANALHHSTCVIPKGSLIAPEDLPADAIVPANWMSKLKGDLPVSMISIPATHDAGTARGTFGWSRCQVMTLPAQLATGIRGFDIRLRQVDGKLLIYHSEESQRLAFQDVMKTFSKFLKDHPSEFIVMRIREESKAIRPVTTFEAAFEKFSQSPSYAGLFFKATDRRQIPTVDDLRGKIFVLDNYGKLPNTVDYPNASMKVQDDYDISDMDKKYREIIENMDGSLENTDTKVWFVNYTSSCSDKVDQLMNATAVNPKVDNYLTVKKGHLGLVLMNFPGISMIQKIVHSNF